MTSRAVAIASELRKYPFFSGFPETLLERFAEMTTEVHCKAGERLLEQGQKNDRLFFLREGRVSVLVDGEVISELSSSGDVIGEMSLINQRPIAASVRAETDVRAFRVSESFLDTLTDDQRSEFQSLLYRVCASVLAERLTRTNEKAKKFEISNRELRSAQEILAKINSDLEEAIARRSVELVEKVRLLTETHLQPAYALLTQMLENETESKDIVEIGSEGTKLIKLRRMIGEVVDFLKPVSDLGGRSQSLSSRRVLLYDKDRKQAAIAKLALGGTGVNLSIAASMEELKSFLVEDFDLILCDAEMREEINFVFETKPDIPLAFMTGLDMGVSLRILEEMPANGYFVSRDVNDRSFTVKSISATVSKILNQDFFGIEKYLTWGARIIERPVAKSEEREGLIDEMIAHFQALGMRSVLLDRVRVAGEELLMNAIYDAPVDHNGKPLYNHLPRTEPVELSQEQQGRFRFGTDGIYMGLSVVDPFGSLTKDVILSYLKSCYSGQAGELNKGKGGAGRGLHQIIESADLTVFNVKAGKRTEAICLFGLEPRKGESARPTFHLFFS